MAKMIRKFIVWNVKKIAKYHETNANNIGKLSTLKSNISAKNVDKVKYASIARPRLPDFIQNSNDYFYNLHVD